MAAAMQRAPALGGGRRELNLKIVEPPKPNVPVPTPIQASAPTLPAAPTDALDTQPAWISSPNAPAAAAPAASAEPAQPGQPVAAPALAAAMPMPAPALAPEQDVDEHPDSLALPRLAPESGEPAAPSSSYAASDDDAASSAHPASGRWYSPGTALVVAMAALAWRLLDAYAQAKLPAKVASGASLDQFDALVNRIPIAGNTIGMVLGFLLIAGALALLGIGWRFAVRSLALQVAVAAVVLLAAVGPILAG